MVYRIAGAIFFILYGVAALFGSNIPAWVIGVAALVAGVALAFGK